MPEDMPAVDVATEGGRLGIARVLRSAGLVSSNSEAFRLIGQGAVRLDGERIEDRSLELEAGSTHVCQVGKRRFARVTLT
jgi:tyrosyl-tRNA synthetase